MINIDLRTIVFSYLLTSIVSFVVMILLWYQSRKRFKGTHYLVLGFAAQVSGLFLIFLRNHINDFVSIDVSNTLIFAGSIFHLIGLEQFVGKKRRSRFFYFAFIVIFFLIHTYFTFISPSIIARHYNSSIAYAFISSMIAWLLIFEAPASFRRSTVHLGIVYVLLIVFNLVRIVFYLISNTHDTEYFSSGIFETFVIISYQVLYMYLTYALILMVNKQLMEIIKLEEEKFSKAFYLAPYAVLLTRISDGNIFEVNKSFCDMAGYSKDEVAGQTTLKLKIWANESDRETFVELLTQKKEVKNMEFTFRKKNGDLLTGLISSIIISIHNETIILSTIIDITDRKLMELKLTEMNATKDKFFSIIAHDLKSPFNSLLGLSEILEERIADKEYEDSGKVSKLIHQTAQKAMDLVVNLLEWSRTQTGKIEFNPEYLQVNDLILECYQLFDELFKKKSIQSELQVPRNSIIFADKAMISSVIRNLISNALKFTAKGGKITMESFLNDGEWVFQITDSGIGISPENQKKLFRTDESYSTKGTENESGTGLGLILSKEFIEKHGGSIKVESEVGKGTTIQFSIPLR